MSIKIIIIIIMVEKVHNEKLHSLHRSPSIVRVIKSRRLRLAVHVVRMEEGRSAFKILTVKYRGKRSLGRHRRRWEDNTPLLNLTDDVSSLSTDKWKWDQQSVGRSWPCMGCKTFGILLIDGRWNRSWGKPRFERGLFFLRYMIFSSISREKHFP